MNELKFDVAAARLAAMKGLAINVRDQIREALRLDLELAQAHETPPHIGLHFNMDDLLEDTEYKVNHDYSGVISADFGDFELEIESDGGAYVHMNWQYEGNLETETQCLDFDPSEEMQLCVYVHETIKLRLDTDEDPKYDEFVRQLELKKENWF